jgi:hypothetical protein
LRLAAPAALQLLDLQIRANAIETLATGVLAEHAPALVRTLLGYTKATSALTPRVFTWLVSTNKVCRCATAHQQRLINRRIIMTWPRMWSLPKEIIDAQRLINTAHHYPL